MPQSSSFGVFDRLPMRYSELSISRCTSLIALTDGRSLHARYCKFAIKSEGAMAKARAVQTFSLSRVTAADLPAIVELEHASYPVDEAASREELEFRATAAPELFLIVRTENGLSGFVVATAAAAGTRTLTAETMRTHEASGDVVCIHSVVVRGAERRRGLGAEMMRRYLVEIRALGMYTRVVLLAKERLISFYEGVGFSVIGRSEVVHGQEQWYDLGMDL